MLSTPHMHGMQCQSHAVSKPKYAILSAVFLCQELKAQLEADNPKPAGSSKAVATAPASAVAATSAPSTDHDCQSGAGDGAESSGNADEGAPAGTAAKAPAPAAAAAATAAKVQPWLLTPGHLLLCVNPLAICSVLILSSGAAYLHRLVSQKLNSHILLTQVKAKAPAKKKTAAATVSAAAAAVEAGDDEEESIEQELMNVNWEVRCALCQMQASSHSMHEIMQSN